MLIITRINLFRTKILFDEYGTYMYIDVIMNIHNVLYRHKDLVN